MSVERFADIVMANTGYKDSQLDSEEHLVNSIGTIIDALKTEEYDPHQGKEDTESNANFLSISQFLILLFKFFIVVQATSKNECHEVKDFITWISELKLTHEGIDAAGKHVGSAILEGQFHKGIDEMSERENKGEVEGCLARKQIEQDH